jgi:hypothetical protein
MWRCIKNNVLKTPIFIFAFSPINFRKFIWIYSNAVCSCAVSFLFFLDQCLLKNTNMNWTVKKKEIFNKFISKRGIISLGHSSILRRIWLNFMTLLGVFRLFYSFHNFFRISNFFGLSITEETLLVEVRVWCINIGIVHRRKSTLYRPLRNKLMLQGFQHSCFANSLIVTTV